MAEKQGLSRMLTLEVTRVTERAAILSSMLAGRGDEKAADQAAVDAMRTELNKLDIDGTIVIGEGERDEAPMLYIGYPEGTIDLDWTPEENVRSLAKAKGVEPSQICVCILDRPRHEKMIASVRATGARVTLITDGDIAGVIYTTDPTTGIDMYMGIGGAPEGVLAAAALRCIGGQMQGRLVTDSEDQKARAAKMGVKDFNKKYTMEEMASGDVIFAATGVTDGNILEGIRYVRGGFTTHSVVMRSKTGTVRYVKAMHPDMGKFTKE